MEPTAIFVGHSYVKRYSTWIGSRHSMAPRHPLDICSKLRDLQFLAKSGLQSTELDDEYLFHASKYDIVLIDCSSNDLANGQSVSAVAKNLLVFARQCLENGATIVYILSALNRGKRIDTSTRDFAERVKAFNIYMKNLCVTDANISFHRITGFMQQRDQHAERPLELRNWSDDLIHPSPHRRQPHLKSGMEKYHQSVKTALYRAAQRFKTLKSAQ